MKALIVTLAFAVAGIAFADTRVEHDYANALRGIALDNACLTATQVKTIKPQKECTNLVAVPVPGWNPEMGGPQVDYVCKKWELLHSTASRNYADPVCLKYRYEPDGNMFCDELGQKAKFLPDVIKVREVSSWGDGDNWPGVEKEFKFPACAN